MIKKILFCLMLVFQAALYSCADAAHLSVEEKVGQLLLVHFHGKQINQAAETLIKQAHVSGFVYYSFANGLHSAEQVLNLSDGLQMLAKQTPSSIPLILTVDQEGGIFSRLRRGFTVFPSQAAIGKTGDPHLAYQSARAVGHELASVGINMILGPVADVATNPCNPIIGIRAFSSDPYEVSTFALEAIKGYHDAGMMTCIKHFPGHGDVAVDSHEGLPVVDKSLEALELMELPPFRELCRESDAVMTAHLLVRALDSERCATLSPLIIEQLLRKQMQFEGVVVSDSLAMGGVLAGCSNPAEAAIQAFEAGCDLLILGGRIWSKNGFELRPKDVVEIHQSLVQAVKSGRISEKRLESSVARILALKKRLPCSPAPYCSASHRQLATKVAHHALRGQNVSFVPLNNLRTAVFAPQIVKEMIPEIGGETDYFFWEGMNPSDEELSVMLKMRDAAEAVVTFSFNAWKFHGQRQAILELIEGDKPSIVIVTRDPLDSTFFDAAGIVITTSSLDPFSLQSAVDLVTNLKYGE